MMRAAGRFVPRPAAAAGADYRPALRPPQFAPIPSLDRAVLDKVPLEQIPSVEARSVRSVLGSVSTHHPRPGTKNAKRERGGMMKRFLFKRRHTVLAVLVVIATAVKVQAADEADWWKAERDVMAQLMQPDASLVELVQATRRAKPASAQEALEQLSVFTRVGLAKDAVGALRELQRFRPNFGGAAPALFHDLTRERESWDAAAALLEIFAETIPPNSGVVEPLVEHFLADGQTVKQVDDWLAAKPAGVDNVWINERLAFLMRNGQGAELEKNLADRARNHPQDGGKAIEYLAAVQFVFPYRQTPQPDLKWMAEVCRPQLATQAVEIAEILRWLKAPETAVVFQRMAIALELTDAELHEMAKLSQAMTSEESLRASFAVRTRERLADLLLQTGAADEAQKFMLEAAEIRERAGLGRNALLAGRTQAASGRRVVENQILAAEKLSEDDPRYWRERASYYHGREEFELEEQALRRRLALTAPQLEAPLKSLSDSRRRAVNDLAYFLVQRKRLSETVDLLRAELIEAPADSDASEGAARFFAYEIPDEIHGDDPVLWNWLANRPVWDNVERRLLWRMLEHAAPELPDRAFLSPADGQLVAREPRPLKGLDQQLQQAEKLAIGDDPSRGLTLGWILNRMKLTERSLAPLEDALRRATDDEMKEDIAFTLLESNLASQDWRRADELFPIARGKLTPSEIVEWQLRIATLAAQTAAKEDALRIFRQAANLDLANVSITENRQSLQALVAAGLRDDLVEHYQDFQTALPDSDIPSRMLQWLQPPAAEGAALQ